MCTYFRLVICQDIYLQVAQLAEDLHVSQDSTMHDSDPFPLLANLLLLPLLPRVPYIDMILYAV